MRRSNASGTPGATREASGSGLAALESVSALRGIGDLVAVDGVRAVEPRQCVDIAAGGLEGVGVGVAKPEHPRLPALGNKRAQREGPQRGVQLTEAPGGARLDDRH